MRIGVLHNGLFAERAFGDRAHTIDSIYIHRFRHYTIWRYPVFIVPLHTDQIFLDSQKSLFEKYVHLGGVLVLLGASAEVRPWLPLCQWESGWPHDIQIYNEGPDAAVIFKGIANKPASYLKYHSHYYGHGSITDIHATDHVNVQYLAEDQRGRKMMLIRSLLNGGTLFVTTLDPDHHAVAGVPGDPREGVEEPHSKARRLLTNILDWATEETRKAPQAFRRKCRYYAGLAFHYSTRTAVNILPVLSLGVFAYLTYDPSNAVKMSSFLINLLAVMASVASIYSACREQRAERGK